MIPGAKSEALPGARPEGREAGGVGVWWRAEGSRGFDRRSIVALALILAGPALLVAGFLSFQICGAGLSLILFAGSVGVVGGAVARIGGLAVILPAVLAVVTLGWAGWVLASGAGCAF
jgi:hypothetical protein